VIENVEELGEMLDKYDEVVKKMQSKLESNNEKFCKEFSELIDDLIRK
jgi:hypothetical protein